MPHSLFNALTSGTLFRQQYRLLEQIGVGGEGVVWSALDERRGQILAIKFRDVPEAEVEAQTAADSGHLANLSKLRHPHVLPILGHGFEAHLQFMVSPYLPGGTLFQRIKLGPMTIHEIVRSGTEIAQALDYLHSQGIVHRDLKSQNILLDLRNTCYLTDFGLARLMTTSTLAFHTGHGTPPYASPEQIQSRPMTHKSDLFSFGILLYEMFTGQLPWNGKKQLGMEQLTANTQELPDPRDFNDKLPPYITNILRRVTSANPEQRPLSASEIMRALRHVFDQPNETPPAEKSLTSWTIRDDDLKEMLQRSYAQWQASDGTFNLGLTKFALIDLKRANINTETYTTFLLSQALTYAYHDDQWWQTVADPQARLNVATGLLKKHNETITGRIVTRLTEDADISALPPDQLENMTTGLLETGVKTENAFLRREIFDGLRVLSQPRNDWTADSALDADKAGKLAGFALEDSEFGDTAAELIGHLRSAHAVRVLLKRSKRDRKIAALLLIQRTAGSLPAFVPNDLRYRLTTEWLLEHLLQEPVSLIGVYMLALLGAALGVGMQVYLTYNLPNFLDTARIITSIEQGLIVGAIFALGVFGIRVVMERFQSAPAIPRVLVATFIGWLGMNIALLIFHVLFLSTPPRGILLPAACLLMAITFSVGGLFRARLLRIILSGGAVFVAIFGSWWLHAVYAALPTDLTPLFYYAYTWTLPQVALTAAGIAGFIGIFGNLLNLSLIRD